MEIILKAEKNDEIIKSNESIIMENNDEDL